MGPGRSVLLTAVGWVVVSLVGVPLTSSSVTTATSPSLHHTQQFVDRGQRAKEIVLHLPNDTPRPFSTEIVLDEPWIGAGTAACLPPISAYRGQTRACFHAPSFFSRAISPLSAILNSNLVASMTKKRATVFVRSWLSQRCSE